MNAIIRPSLTDTVAVSPGSINLTKSQMGLVRDMNRTLTDREFDQFIATSIALGLNPLARQVCAIVFNAKNAEKRQMAIVSTISGLRAIADRTGTYRPDDKPARFEDDPQLRDPKVNPHGLISCTVTPFRFSHGEWHPVVGQIWWDEIAPIVTWDGERKLDNRTPWPSRPRGQFMKCAEADALRKGWPENLANVYVAEEVDRSLALDMAPSQLAAQAQTERITDKVMPKGSIIMDLMDGRGLVPVEIGKFHDTAASFIARHGQEDPEGTLSWRDQNRIAFQQFFAHDKGAALDLKRKFEDLEKLVAGAA